MLDSINAEEIVVILIEVIVKVLFICHEYTNMFFPNYYNPGVQNIYCSAACMIVCFLHSIPVSGAHVYARSDPLRAYGCLQSHIPKGSYRRAKLGKKPDQ